MRRWLPLYALAAVSCASVPHLDDVKRTLSAEDSGTVWFATAGSLVLSRARYVPGEPVALSGELQLPSGAGPHPAVILAHGCNGLSRNVAAWAQALRSWGYATFVVDSFGGRGLTEVCGKPGILSGTQRIPDAYGALRLLATHPGIDAGRVALMGFSHGGSLTLGASTAWARASYAPVGQPAFRAFFAFYPGCNSLYPERERISAPLRIHIGDLDDWTPAPPCVAYAQSLKASGQDAAIAVYAGAHHAFDGFAAGVPRLPIDTPADCVFRPPSLVGPFRPASEYAGCIRRGVTVASNPQATEQARRSVQEQLAELLRPLPR